MNKVLEQLRQTIEKHNLIVKGDRLVIGVSGGPDSLCLLHALLELKDALLIEQIVVVHVNHVYRGIPADEDQHFTEAFCSARGVKYYSYRSDVENLAKEWGMSSEEAGRKVRYEAFFEIAEKLGGAKVVVAQNSEDQAETVLMRIIRGTGTDGLAGIEHNRDNKVIRPLLDISRAEIEAYCSENNLQPRQDHTNKEPIYTRNKIRLNLIPYINQQFEGNVSDSLRRLAEIAQEDKNFIYSFVEKELENVLFKYGRAEIDRDKLAKLHPAIAKRLILRIFGVLGQRKDIGQLHLDHALYLLNHGETTADTAFPGGYRMQCRYDKIYFTGLENKQKADFNYELEINKDCYISELEMMISTRILNEDEVKKIKDNRLLECKTEKESLTAYFDLDKIKRPLLVRTRRDGDTFMPFGLSGRKKIKEFFINEKINRDLRDRIPLICDGGEIIWVVGYRTAEGYKIEKDTKRILEIKAK